MLGDMYRFGQGVTENLEEAVKHYQTGAEQGRLRWMLTLEDIINFSIIALKKCHRSERGTAEHEG